MYVVASNLIMCRDNLWQMLGSSGHDLTPESALMKLAYLLSYEDFSNEEVKTSDANQHTGRVNRQHSH